MCPSVSGSPEANLTKAVRPIRDLSSNKVHDKANRFWARSHSGFAHTSFLYEPLKSIGAFWVSRPCKVFGAARAEKFQLGISALESLRVNGETLVRVNI